MKIDFYLRFHTHFGERIAVVGNIPALGNGDVSKALPLSFLNEESWHTSIEIDPADIEVLEYRYVFISDTDGITKEGERDRKVPVRFDAHVALVDTWNDESFYENAFYTAPFTEVFFRDRHRVKSGRKKEQREPGTHLLKVKAPLLKDDEMLCILGSGEALGNWDTEKPLLLRT
ncbi:MAG TPA: carbohydrate-binding module family 20 domain-containing protein, partial [Flavisolibacter sp.]